MKNITHVIHKHTEIENDLNRYAKIIKTELEEAGEIYVRCHGVGVIPMWNITIADELEGPIDEHDCYLVGDLRIWLGERFGEYRKPLLVDLHNFLTWLCEEREDEK